MIPGMERGGYQWWRSLAILGILILTSCEGMDYYHGTGKFNTVVLDAGHGGYDMGGRAVYGEMNEKILALDIVKRINAILCHKGYHTILTRTDDTFIPLGKRTEISNHTPNSIFVSIHINWSRNRSAHGLETFYYLPNSRRLATNILREIGQVYATPIRGVKFARFHVLRYNLRPAVLCELGFDSNRFENGLLRKAQHRQSLAEAVARGIILEAEGRIP
ncbi:MAG: N-acetylmuramoyl-L-alanine amidase [Verrucomicrobia bacterium]|nr:MAG: N-acetylmuramoyl-L-alanine amidase [Verrucomicrobiota bacterium]